MGGVGELAGWEQEGEVLADRGVLGESRGEVKVVFLLQGISEILSFLNPLLS